MDGYYFFFLLLGRSAVEDRSRSSSLGWTSGLSDRPPLPRFFFFPVQQKFGFLVLLLLLLLLLLLSFKVRVLQQILGTRERFAPENTVQVSSMDGYYFFFLLLGRSAVEDRSRSSSLGWTSGLSDRPPLPRFFFFPVQQKFGFLVLLLLLLLLLLSFKVRVLQQILGTRERFAPENTVQVSSMDGYYFFFLLLGFSHQKRKGCSFTGEEDEREGQDMGQGRRGWEWMLELSAWPERPLPEARRLI
ncbi:putative GTP-binding protein OBGM, mitochondrial [Iris pallida]|uniref:GTP-binding protein OBGM, mitochondrial n=1 Tax=Iris pallida TaxID=29817 RepID=A0AAX6EV11_IRIPA|nr:putative GTP-binding protein OBGM, mitochondrial [Iris pallida]